MVVVLENGLGNIFSSVIAEETIPELSSLLHLTVLIQVRAEVELHPNAFVSCTLYLPAVPVI